MFNSQGKWIMEFKVGSKVFYPSHGAGWIKDQKEIEFNDQKKMYFEFAFINSPISISTPLDNIENLNIRAVESPEQIKEKIKVLKKTPNKDPKTKDFNKLIEILRRLEKQATVESAIETIQYCNFVKKVREKDGRLFPVSIESELKRAVGDIVGELAVSSDIEFMAAAEIFREITGLTVEIVQSKYYNA